MNMLQHVKRYVALKRHLGCRYDMEPFTLRSYARHAEARGERFIVLSSVIEWASGASSADAARRRIQLLRNFSIWLHAEERRHEVVPRHALGRRSKHRPTPCLLTPSQIALLMEAALGLRPAESITPQTFHFMIGLASATGLRANEVVSLRMRDLTADGLIIRNTKFGKTRLVPLHDTVRQALRDYLKIRQTVPSVDDHLFILRTGKPPTSGYFSQTFGKLIRRVGLKTGPRGASPSLHSLRHSFAVRSLENAGIGDRFTVAQHMMALTTYLGHAHVSSTYWYLEATPPVLRSVADAGERTFSGRTP